MGLGKICCSCCFQMRRTCVGFKGNGKEPIREDSSEVTGVGGGMEGARRAELWMRERSSLETGKGEEEMGVEADPFMELV